MMFMLVGDVDSVQKNGSCRLTGLARNDVQSGRLTRSVGTNQAAQLSLIDGEVQAVDRFEAIKAYFQTFCL